MSAEESNDSEVRATASQTPRRRRQDVERHPTQQEVAERLGVSVRTVKRDERIVRAWLELHFCRAVRQTIPELDSSEISYKVRFYGIACPLPRR